ncbi:hypothetical protein PR202_gb05713 [Eleusine coracana subsp. coracana]|uniref:Uncharacterized protein n=1 Tax=Eleusine coracana subsp. coracana TaxID=191504 RepID=A0AAV5E8M9_ELECO|nr:hypothetical protein PR202_gb05713 [Eleusine coracana subsp. coracana]
MLQGHRHGAKEEGEPLRRELVEAVVRRGAVRGGQRGFVGGRVQEAGAAQGAERRGEGRAAVQGRGAGLDALLARAARPALQGRGPRPAQPRRDRRRHVALRARIRLPAAPRGRRRRRCPRARRLRRARRRPDRRRRRARGRCSRAVRRVRRTCRPAGGGLNSGSWTKTEASTTQLGHNTSTLHPRSERTSTAQY